MIAVLPLVLYPLLGMSMTQIAQFKREHATEVLVLGDTDFAGIPPLVSGDRFAANLFSDPEKAKLIRLHFVKNGGDKTDAAVSTEEQAGKLAAARKAVEAGSVEAALYFPPDFADRLARYRASLLNRDEAEPPAEEALPEPVIICNTAKEKSQLAQLRVMEILNRWRELIGKQNLADSKMPATDAKPFELTTEDVALPSLRKAHLWSNVLPFVLLLWALTGAFYPAVDLCAGEKERGTLETLLSSPAERSEIVWGKLLTIMLFSMATAVLNLASMGITGSFVLSQVPQMGPPPWMAIVWLLLALPPVSALFSALCLALAAFARSTKEGQYYLMPLVLITMPLTILPMTPGVDLNLGNSLIPITGIVLLLRTMLEGDYMEALPYIPVVAGVTLGCCLLAVRWAADQFNSESVLFRESERFDLGLWLKHLMRDREDTPSVTEAVFCGVLILLVQFFLSMRLPANLDFLSLALTSQLVMIATPALLMTVMFTRSPVKTLLLRIPPLRTLPVAVALAFAMHPVVNRLGSIVRDLYPLSEDVKERLAGLKIGEHNIWLLVLVVAVVPAICEELAFRGFILSGLRHMGHKWRAIILSSLFFGLTHGIIQQSLVACLGGVVLGYLAVQTGSLLPGMLYHVVNNSLTFLVASWFEDDGAGAAVKQAVKHLVRLENNEVVYSWPAAILGALVAAAILFWFRNLPYKRSAEEKLQEAIDHQSAASLV